METTAFFDNTIDLRTKSTSDMDQVLSYDQLKRLSIHKYSAQGISILEPFMQHFWRWLVELFPLWCAPNAITLAGLIINAASTFIIILYCPAFIGEAPRWSYMLCAGGLFIYQALDAIDGKQARRTDSSTPLGELFDHGCDALSIVFIVIGTCITVELGTHPSLVFVECFASMFVYYAAHWQTYCSATLQFGRIDVTEAQLAVVFIYAITGIFGTSIWSMTIPLIDLPLKLVPVITSISAALIACRDYFTVIFIRGGVGKNGSTVAGTSVLSPIFPIASLMVLAMSIAALSPSHIFHRHPVIYVLAFGFSSSKLSNKLVLAHMSRSEMTWFDSCFVGPLLLLVNIKFSAFIEEFYLLCFCLIFSAIDLILNSVKVCQLICDHMNISCFSITPPLHPSSSFSHSVSPLINHQPAPQLAGRVRVTRATGGAFGFEQSRSEDHRVTCMSYTNTDKKLSH